MLEVSSFIYCILYFLMYCYLFNKFIVNYKFIINYKIIISSIIIGIIFLMVSNSSYLYLRPTLLHLYYIVSFKYIYRQSFFKCLIGVFGILFLMLCSELIYDFFVVLVLNINIQSLSQSVVGYLVSNTSIFLLCIMMSKIKIINKFFDKIINWYNKISDFKILMFLFIMFSVIVTFILYNNFIKILPNSLLLFTNVFCVGVMTFVIAYFRTKANNNRIVYEYDQLLNYVKIYERVIDEKSKNQHEYKNQLVLIRDMLDAKNKKAIDYINNILDIEEDNVNFELLKKLNNLPQGGLRGLIYYKIENMIEEGIDAYIEISPKLNNKNYEAIINSNLNDLSKIVGVYLDNCIEAVKNVKNKYIVIEVNVIRDNIVFSFSNTYEGQLNLIKIDKEGYTTKGKGKGYGLSLVKDIIDNNDIFSQEREINGPYYVQKLLIKK